DVRIESATGDVTPPRVSIGVSPISKVILRGTLAGQIRFVSRIPSGGPAIRIDYLVDGELIASRRDRLFTVDFDSRNLGNGTHTLTVRAWDGAGNVGIAVKSFKVFNPPIADSLAIPRHYDHIRYAALAYYGLNVGTFEGDLLQNSVDLVVPNAR